MVIVLIVVITVLVALAAAVVLGRRRTAATARAERDEEIRAALAEPAPIADDPATTDRGAEDRDDVPPAPADRTGTALPSTEPVDSADAEALDADRDPWAEVTNDAAASPAPANGTGTNGHSTTPRSTGADTDSDAVGPAAAIRMTVTGTHPWAPARMFLTDLRSDGFDTTVELPDLVVVRNLDRLPITVREPAGPPGQLIVTTPPELLSDTLETLVRALLDSGFVIDATDGREVRLVDDHEARVDLHITELAAA